MKYLFTFSLFESKESVDEICKKYNIKNYTINDDKSIDVNGNVDLNGKKLTKLPLKFNKLSGYFDCSYNQLTSLEGSPKSVSGDFDCSNNQLASLEGSPQSVGGYFYCSHNQLTSLEGSPQSVGYFDCSYNQLTSLEGSPKSVSGDFGCNNNQIKDFNGFPEYFENDLYIWDNPVSNVYELFDDALKITLFNEYDIIRENEIILDRLNDFLNHIGESEVNSVKEYICI